MMKCTQCGCEKLNAINLCDLIRATDGVRVDKAKSLEIYVCNHCGHLEFFDNAFNAKLAKEKEIMDKTEATIKEFESEKIAFSQKQKEIEDGILKSLQEELQAVETLLDSLDITIRQQQELIIRKEELNEQIRKVHSEIYDINRKMEQLDSKISHEKWENDQALRTLAREDEKNRFNI